MKTCSMCKQEKPDEDFAWKRPALGQRQSECKPCKRTYQAKWYALNKKRHIASVKKNSRRYEQEIREELWTYLSTHPCIDCGEKDPIVLEFDHQYGKRKMVSRMRSLTLVRKEIKKCQVRCANCHRRRTAAQLGWWKAARAGLVTQLAE